MGVSSSRIEEDKALQLCRERKRFVRQALDGRCSLAAAHITYIQSLKNIGIALRKFVEPDATLESSLYTSTTATPELLALTDKSFSHFSFSSPSLSQHVDVAETLSPTPSPPTSGHFHANYMKTVISSSKNVEEKSPFPVTWTLRSTSSTPQNLTPQSTERPETPEFEHSHPSPEPAWDFFGPPHNIDTQISFQQGREPNNELDNPVNVGRLREEEGIPDLEDEGGKVAFSESADSEVSEDEFDEPSTDNLVRSFKNHRVLDSHSITMSPTLPSEKTIASETEVLNGRSDSADLTPVKTADSVVITPTYENKTTEKVRGITNKLAGKDFLTSIKEIECLFLKASDSGKEVPRMLEANKLHFRPIFPGKEGESRMFMLFKACLSCGEDPTPVPEEPAQPSMKYLTWHRTVSSRSSSSRNPLGATSKDDAEDDGSNIFESFCMNSGSHASTLDRLYAWERKLYDEVKASGIIRREYDMKCKLLRQRDSNGESVFKIDKTRAVVKDLHSRIRVAIHRIDSISRRIEELRDRELQPQLEELIEGLSRMWQMMFECHALQFKIISDADKGSIKVSVQSESQRQAAVHLEHELSSLSSSFMKWINAQKLYVQAINGWLHKCVSLQQKSSRRKRKEPDIRLSTLGPHIFLICDVWKKKLESLSAKEVAGSIKALAADTACFLPLQEKKRGKSFLASQESNGIDGAAIKLRDEAAEERFRSSLVSFLDHLNSFALSSMNMYGELENANAEKRTH